MVAGFQRVNTVVHLTCRAKLGRKKKDTYSVGSGHLFLKKFYCIQRRRVFLALPCVAQCVAYSHATSQSPCHSLANRIRMVVLLYEIVNDLY